MKKIVTALTLLYGTLAHASSPAPAVSVALEATEEGLVRLDLRADAEEGYRLDVRQLVESPSGLVASVPVAAVGIGPGQRRAIVPPRIAVAGAVVRIRFEVLATGMRTGRQSQLVADRAFAVAPDGKLQPLTFEEERQLAPAGITLTGEPVPAAVLDRLLQEVADGRAR